MYMVYFYYFEQILAAPWNISKCPLTVYPYIIKGRTYRGIQYYA